MANRSRNNEGIRLVVASLDNKTAAHYATTWSSFCAFCKRAGVSSLPASQRTFLEYLDYRVDHNLVAAGELKSLFADINTMHVAHGLKRPATGPNV